MKLYLRWVGIAALLLAIAAALPVRMAVRAAPLPEVSAAGRVFYVASNGQDGNPGTAARPWRTIGKAASVLAPGDVVYIKNGTYQENIKLDWRNAGKPGRPIAYRAYPGHAPVLDGTGVRTVFRGLFELTGCDYIEISGLHIRNSVLAGIHVRGSEHVTIRNNRIERSKSSGIGVWRSSDIVVEANVLVDTRIDPKGGNEMLTMSSVQRFHVLYNEVYWTNKDCCGSTAGINVKQASTDGWVIGNSLHDLPSTGIYIDGWDGGNHDHHISGNSIHNASTGISLGAERGGTLSNIYIYNNVIHQMMFCGIRFQDVGQDGLRQNIYIYHNTIVGAYGHGGAGILVATSRVRNVVLTNNLINFGPDTNVGQIKAYNPAAITSSTNLVYGPKSSTQDSKLVELTQGTITAAPRFVDAAHRNFSLRADSPARDRGTKMDLAHDHQGVSRPQGTGVDIGAYEYRVVGPMNHRAFVPVVER